MALPAASQGQQPLVLDQESLNALLASGAIIPATSAGNYIAMSGPVLQAMPQMVVPQHFMQQPQQGQVRPAPTRMLRKWTGSWLLFFLCCFGGTRSTWVGCRSERSDVAGTA